MCPEHSSHRLFQKLILGKVYKDVDRMMDSLAGTGPQHRNYPPHDPTTFTALYINDSEKLAAAWLHYLLDRTDSAMKKEARRRGKTK